MKSCALTSLFLFMAALFVAMLAVFTWINSPAVEQQRAADVAYQVEKGKLELAERQRKAEADARFWASVEPFAAVAVSLTLLLGPTALLAGGVGFWLWARHRSRLVYPNAAGMLPADYDRLRLGEYDQHAMAGLIGFHTAEAERARNPSPALPPMLRTYAPRYGSPRAIGQDPTRPAALPQFEVTAPPAALPLPGPVDLAGLLTTPPSLDRVLLALGPGGEPLTASAKDMTHIALAGSTGNGKSNILRMILAQVLAAGAGAVLADPHYAPVDPESGEDWRPIERRLTAPPAVTPAQIAELLAWLSEELQRRLELRRAGERVGRPLYFACDELPAIYAHVPGADAVLGEIVREGRKTRIYALTSAQDFLTRTVGGSAAARENFRTCYYVGGDKTTARQLLDLQGRVDDAGLGAGLAWLRSKATPTAQLVRIPYASNAALAGLLPPPSPNFGTAVPAPPSAIITPRQVGGGASDGPSWDPAPVVGRSEGRTVDAAPVENGAKTTVDAPSDRPTVLPFTRRPVTLTAKAQAAGMPLSAEDLEALGQADRGASPQTIARAQTGQDGGRVYTRRRDEVTRLIDLVKNWPAGETWGDAEAGGSGEA